eukprot:CAMPEP_0198272944 /NCGR_PEP_ID=MMETSP1447-20131203/55092_1 /TAXON_ID=420782 /ORGANISM="Chaetoceros dichaeta, Strain CCMP1751" /LENGTH=186 /DNA_ID=CAMNT_0043966397 /DNA_START=21 /DNA_END=577 /DNA_ORIENTATION=+
MASTTTTKITAVTIKPKTESATPAPPTTAPIKPATNNNATIPKGAKSMTPTNSAIPHPPPSQCPTPTQPSPKAKTISNTSTTPSLKRKRVYKRPFPSDNPSTPSTTTITTNNIINTTPAQATSLRGVVMGSSEPKPTDNPHPQTQTQTQAQQPVSPHIYDAMLGEISDLLAAASQAQLLGRLKMAS